eukprot:c9416_g1_i4.p1 GENE.c9416_g1_i4~~c9416_g1_i4.p1  ORF type:complete len:106 (+),score=20.98 c9416_g1_i4:44-361(+)
MDTLARIVGEHLPRLARASARLGALECVGSAGGGQVKSTLRGKGQLVSIHIEPTALSEPEALQQLVKLSHANALQKLEKEREKIIAEDLPELHSIREWVGRVPFP